MVQGLSFDAIAVLHDASSSVDDKLHVAKLLKNIIVGQDQRKVLAVKSDIIQPLANIISSYIPSKAAGKARRDAASNRLVLADETPASSADELRQQAVLILGTLAAGGHPFLRPLCAANVPTLLIDTLSSGVSSKLVTAILKALREFAVIWEPSDVNDQARHFWAKLFNPRSLEVFDFVLREQRSPQGRQQLKLVAEIVAELPPVEESVKDVLTNSGLLDTLSGLLVSDSVATAVTLYAGETANLLRPPPSSAIPSILSAISTIVDGSVYRAHRFLLSPQVRELFGRSSHGRDGPDDSRVLFGPRYGFENQLEKTLLPPLHIPVYVSVTHRPIESINFPASKLLQASKIGNTLADVPAPMISDIDHTNAVCGWLLVLARSWTGIYRLAALRLLALLTTAIATDALIGARSNDFTQKTRERERQLALLAVPLAVGLVHVAGEVGPTSTTQELQDHRVIQEEACVVLALLVRGNKDLQMAAFYSEAVKHIAVVLRKSFDNAQPAKPMWRNKSETQPIFNLAETCQLGSSGLPAEMSHAMQCRRGALQALEAITALEDDPRKSVSGQGIIGYIIESLKPFAPHAFANEALDAPAISPKDGNTIPVIIAACHAVQSLSRSVAVLRTSLIDGGLAKPLIELLHHASLDVQIAATDVCCNLLADTSPMREEISEASAKTLALHARGTSPALTFSSLWALKHLMIKCPKDFKIDTIKLLGLDWLIGVIRGEHLPHATPAASGGSAALSTPNAAGQQVDLLNPSTMDLDDPADRYVHAGDDDGDDGDVLYDEASSTHYQASQLRSTLQGPSVASATLKYLSSIQEVESSDDYIARRDELRIQQQALDLIRNFLNGTDCTALTEFLMEQVGSQQLFDLLTAKLLPLPRALTGPRTVYHPTEIVLSTIHVLNHLANAAKCRATIIAQRALLQSLLPHFHHVEPSVRTICVFSVTSLTWVEDDSDRRDARARVQELKALGIEQAVRALIHDPHQDVKERVKTALQQFDMQ